MLTLNEAPHVQSERHHNDASGNFKALPQQHFITEAMPIATNATDSCQQTCENSNALFEQTWLLRSKVDEARESHDRQILDLNNMKNLGKRNMEYVLAKVKSLKTKIQEQAHAEMAAQCSELKRLERLHRKTALAREMAGKSARQYLKISTRRVKEAESTLFESLLRTQKFLKAEIEEGSIRLGSVQGTYGRSNVDEDQTQREACSKQKRKVLGPFSDGTSTSVSVEGHVRLEQTVSTRPDCVTRRPSADANTEHDNRISASSAMDSSDIVERNPPIQQVKATVDAHSASPDIVSRSEADPCMSGVEPVNTLIEERDWAPEISEGVRRAIIKLGDCEQAGWDRQKEHEIHIRTYSEQFEGFCAVVPGMDRDDAGNMFSKIYLERTGRRAKAIKCATQNLRNAQHEAKKAGVYNPNYLNQRSGFFSISDEGREEQGDHGYPENSHPRRYIEWWIGDIQHCEESSHAVVERDAQETAFAFSGPGHELEPWESIPSCAEVWERRKIKEFEKLNAPLQNRKRKASSDQDEDGSINSRRLRQKMNLEEPVDKTPSNKESTA